MFGIATSVRGRVCECTPALFAQAVDNPQTARICAAIADAWERVKRGEMSREDFETYKGEQKKRLAVFTPHATFEGGARKIANAVPSGLSMYDVDHIADPRGYYESKVTGRVEELGIVLAHVTPSTEGLRLFFIVPRGMTLAQAQEWMARELGDETYDTSVKDLARCSFVVPRDYILFMNDEKLFARNAENTCVGCADASADGEADTTDANNKAEDLNTSEGSIGVENYLGFPYARIIAKWFELYN
ncbi:MAG: VirE protein, partial [Bacteroidales bacterium]|nr:VirE protein [Bacteroidales bacterium]